MLLQVNGKAFQVLARARAWQRPEGLSSVDGTIELEVRGPAAPESFVLGLIHGRLEKPRDDSPFLIPLRAEQVGELWAEAKAEWRLEAQERQPRGPRGCCVRVEDARYRISDCEVPDTSAPRHAGQARDVVEARFALGSQHGMQDWPLEVCDPSRIAEFCAFYEETVDPATRFDVMQLALFSYDESPDKSTWSGWFDRVLRRDFALHGHTVAEWAELDLEPDDPELCRPEPELVFSISGMLRRIWEESLVPVSVECTW